MKILYFYQYFCTPSGSWGTRVYEFAKRWVRAGDQVTVITSYYDKSDLKSDKFLDRFNVEGIDIRLINIKLSNQHGFLKRIYSFMVYMVFASWYAITLSSDIVIASSGPLTVGIPGLLARYLRGRKLVFEARDLWPDGAISLGVLKNPILITLARTLEKACYRAAEKIIVLSPGSKRVLLERGVLKDIRVIPNASDNDVFSALTDHFELPDWAKQKQIVLYSGTLGLLDACHQLVLTAEIIQHSNEHLVFVIIGDGKEREYLEKMVSGKELKNIYFLGNQSKHVVAQWLKPAICSLMVTKANPFLDHASPNKMFDAFAAGVPVIQTTQGWIKELFEKEKCGLTVLSENPQMLAEAVLRLSSDTRLRNEMAMNAKKLADEQFNRDKLANQMREILSSCLSKDIK